MKVMVLADTPRIAFEVIEDLPTEWEPEWRFTSEPRRGERFDILIDASWREELAENVEIWKLGLEPDGKFERMDLY